MTLPEENILQMLFQTSTLANVPDEQLKQIAEQYPYYGTAHFLLAKKLYKLNTDDSSNALQKAALHFSNIPWLNFILNDDEKISAAPEVSEATDTLNYDTRTETVNTPGPIETAFTEEDNTVNASEENAAINNKLSSLLQEQAAAFEKPVELLEAIAVENIPYHRVDYFASQGIKLEEGKANDKLENQLKRFTDWLKQMKRINPNPTELRNDEAGEHQVENIAAHSNEAEQILTEAMAEVLIKQGKPEQAILIYEKLSFNNPSKSVYFAAKIEELKG